MIWKVLLIATLVPIVLALLVAILATVTLDMAVNPHVREVLLPRTA